MKTIILYATKHGATREIATRISKHMDSATLHDLKQASTPALADFDCVIIGSPLYAGSIRKEARAFLTTHADQLRGKTVGLFLSGMAPTDEQKYFAGNFSPNILQTAKAARLLGGIFNPQKAGAMAQFIMKAATKQSGYQDTISDEEIEQFAVAMKR